MDALTEKVDRLALMANTSMAASEQALTRLTALRRLEKPDE